MSFIDSGLDVTRICTLGVRRAFFLPLKHAVRGQTRLQFKGHANISITVAAHFSHTCVFKKLKEENGTSLRMIQSSWSCQGLADEACFTLMCLGFF